MSTFFTQSFCSMQQCCSCFLFHSLGRGNIFTFYKNNTSIKKQKRRFSFFLLLCIMTSGLCLRTPSSQIKKELRKVVFFSSTRKVVGGSWIKSSTSSGAASRSGWKFTYRCALYLGHVLWLDMPQPEWA